MSGQVDLTETYKILAGKEGVDPESLFTLDKKQYSTKGARVETLHQKKQTGTEKKFFFSQRVVQH